jgi:hypothetical protein
MALAMTEPPGDREEVGRWQGGFSALPSANLFHINVKKRHCEGSARSNLYKYTRDYKLKPKTTINY